jgi:hypothetical protein
MFLGWTDEDCILNFDAETPFGKIQYENGRRNVKKHALYLISGTQFARMEERWHWFRMAFNGGGLCKTSSGSYQGVSYRHIF